MKKLGRPTDAPKTIVKRARMSEDDIKKYFDTNRIVMRYIGEEKIIL